MENSNIILIPYTIEQLTGIIRSEVREAVKGIPAKETSSKENFLTRKETACKLKISLVTLNGWSKLGRLKSYQIGGRVLYKESEIEASLQKVQTVKY